MTTRYLERPGGRVAYDEEGAGELVLCVPGMGDVRGEYRFLAPALVAAGFRVATMDLRGHGESDATFTDYERTSVGEDVMALIDALGGGPAHLIGASFGAAAAVWAAARAPAQVRTLILIGPFVRDEPLPAAQALAFRMLLARPWGPRAWAWWYRRLYPHHTPPDLDAHIHVLRRRLAEPGRMRALQAMARTSNRDIDPLLDDVRVPSLVVMGTADPDFPDPPAEARAVAERLSGEVALVEEAGHYPHAERPVEAARAITAFL